jgi:magnesium-dependent phosphatase-1
VADCVALVKLVVFDLDRTLWDHPNVSSLVFPLKLVTSDSVEDAEGSRVTLFRGIRETLEAFRDRGLVLSVASWNDPPPVLELLRLFGLEGFFRYPQVEWDVPKVEMIRTIVRLVRRNLRVDVRPEEILFVDDNERHHEIVREQEKEIRLAWAWVNPKSPLELLQPEWLG